MTAPEGRVVGIDLGTVRIGVSVSDPFGLIARPLEVVRRTSRRADIARLRSIVEASEAVHVVLGYPLHLSGEAGVGARSAEEFARDLRRVLGVEVELWDERLTTVQAERAMIEAGASRKRRRATVDAVAAALILQSWLDARGQRSSST